MTQMLTDALRRPERFMQLLQACQCDFNGRLGWADRPYGSPRLLLGVLDAVRNVDAGEIAAACADKAKIPERIRSARVAAVKAMLDQARKGEDQR